MTRLRWILALLVMVINLVSATASAWTFGNDDNVAIPASKGNTATALSTTVSGTSEPSSRSTADTLATPDSSFDELRKTIDAKSITSNATFAKATTAASDIEPIYRNWVGPRAMSPDPACYREAHIMDTCPTHFNRHEVTNTCWAQCPIGYPIQCGLECIRQNDDCIMEVLNKAAALANSVLAIALLGAATKLWDVAKNVPRAMDCVNMMIGSMRSVIRYVRNIQTADPSASADKILNILYQSQNVVTDLPIAVHLCMGWELPRPLDLSGRVLTSINWILLNAIAYKDDLFASWTRFKAFLIGANFTEAANRLNETEIGTLSDALKSNSTCGYELRALTDRTWNTVNQLRADNPGISEDNLRLKMQNTQLMRSDIAIATNNCMEQMIEESDEATAYKTREKVRTAFSGMINQLISKGKSDNGTSEDANQFMYVAMSKTFVSFAVSGLDLIGVMGLIVTYLQPICGPTNFIGEIDDGTDPKTLGLTTVQKAFNNSAISWTRKGDGAVIVNFMSNDTEDVTVNIKSGGKKIDEVDVKAGASAQWRSNITALGGKALYFDRWRPGFLGLPSKAGGSLLLWVPHASEGGHLEVQAKLNVS